MWGYGAQQPTAKGRGRRGARRAPPTAHAAAPALDVQLRPAQLRRELDAEYVDQSMKRHDVTDDPDKLAFRYRAVAAGIDEQFGRFIATPRARKTPRSHHRSLRVRSRQALGRDGYRVHSVFLWESLIRVPVRLHVPKVPERRIEEKVSLADVAPTLTRFMDPTASMAGYQGEDLLGYVLPDRPPRRNPIFIEAASKDVLVRVGMIHPVEDYEARAVARSLVPRALRSEESRVGHCHGHARAAGAHSRRAARARALAGVSEDRRRFRRPRYQRAEGARRRETDSTFSRGVNKGRCRAARVAIIRVMRLEFGLLGRGGARCGAGCLFFGPRLDPERRVGRRRRGGRRRRCW